MNSDEITIPVSQHEQLWQGARRLVLLKSEEYVDCCTVMRMNYGPAEIHDFRVSSRRLREALCLFHSCYDKSLIAECSDEVRMVTRKLGTIRNFDESVLFFSRLSEELDPACRLALTPFLMSREAARVSLLTGLKHFIRHAVPERFLDRYQKCLVRPKLIGSQPETGMFIPLRDFAEGAMAERFNDVVQMCGAALVEGDDSARHQLRIMLKHFRYRFELFKPLYDCRYEHILHLIKQYQECLGKLNDLSVFTRMLSEGVAPVSFMPVLSEAVAKEKKNILRTFLSLTGSNPLSEITSLLHQ